MPQVYHTQNNFNAGQVSPKLRRRSDVTAYQHGVKESINFLPQVHGPLTKRAGTRRVGVAQHNSNLRLVPFIFAEDTAYILEFTNTLMRVFKDGAIVGAPFTLTTPFTTAMLPDIQWAQNDDTMILVHKDLAPQELKRISDTNWTINDVRFDTEPTYEAGAQYGTTLTAAASTGSSVNFTAGAAVWSPSDVNRVVVQLTGPGAGVIKSYTSTTVVVVDILTEFTDVSMADGEWKLLGSPSSDIWIDKIGPKGTTCNIDFYQDFDTSTNGNIIRNGDFSAATGLTNWYDRSAPTVSSGTLTSTGSDNDVDFHDTGATFITDAVQENYIIHNTTAGHYEYVSSVINETYLKGETNGQNHTSGDSYVITQTGSATVDGDDRCILNGQRNGVGWIEQQVGYFPTYSLTLSAASGSGVTATASVASFVSSDVGRIIYEITSGTGVGTVVGYTSPTIVTIDISSAFSGTSISAGNWRLAVDPNRVHALTFRVEDAPLSCQIGSYSKGSDLLEEATYEIGEHTVYYRTSYDDVYIQFRNNQQNNAVVQDVQLKDVSVIAPRTGNANDFIIAEGGIIQIRTVDSSEKRATGAILAELVAAEETEDVRTVQGLWTLEEAAWTSALGYPRVVAFHDQRAYYGSTAEFLSTLWASRIGDYKNFNRGESFDDDAFEITPSTTEISEFRWMVSEQNLMVGTARQEFVITAGIEGTITPTKKKVMTPSKWGGVRHQPIQAGGSVIFVERSGTAVRAMITTEDGYVQQNKDLTVMNDGIADGTVAFPGIKALAWQQRPNPTIWAVLNDGTVISGIYSAEQDVIGWVKHDFGGYCYDLAAISNGAHDQVWLAIRRATGTSIEYMQETGATYGKLVTDATYIYDDVATNDVSDLYWLEGLDIAVTTNNSVTYPNQAVNCGGIFNLYPAITYAEIGLPINASVTLLRPDSPQTPTLGYNINSVKVMLGLHESQGGAIEGMPLYTIFEYPFGVSEEKFSGLLPAYGLSGDGELPELTITHSEGADFTLQSVTYIIERSDL